MYLDIIYLMTNCCLLITTVFPCSSLWNNRKNLKFTGAKLSYYPGFFLVINTMILLLMTICIVTLELMAINQLYLLLIIQIFASFYGIQHYLLLIALAVRLYFIFKKTPMELSKIQIKIFIIFSSLIFISCILIPLLFKILNNKIFIISMIILIIIIISAMIILILSFIFKLHKLHEIGDKEDQSIISLINKTTLLASISIISNILAPISVIIRYKYNLNFINFISNSLVTLDIYTNFSCIVLSYTLYDPLYKIICKCSKCRKSKEKQRSISRKNTIPSTTNPNDRKTISHDLSSGGAVLAKISSYRGVVAHKNKVNPSIIQIPNTINNNNDNNNNFQILATHSSVDNTPTIIDITPTTTDNICDINNTPISDHTSKEEENKKQSVIELETIDYGDDYKSDELYTLQAKFKEFRATSIMENEQIIAQIMDKISDKSEDKSMEKNHHSNFNTMEMNDIFEAIDTQKNDQQN